MATTLAQLDTMIKTRERLKHKTSKMAITMDNSKVLGRITDMRTEKVRESQKFGTNKMRTHNSAWTPVVNKVSNEQIFLERKDLVSHWFDLWTDSQRKRFFDQIFRQCSRKQYKFIQDWFEEQVPLQHLDFSTVLPKFLSLYVMSFLEPKSLSRCAQVSSHWKYLAEQDVLWMPKCLKYGWFLPYTPSRYETGAWKRHYIGCVNSLDYVAANNDMYGLRSDGGQLSPRKGSKREGLTPRESNTMLTSRPPWNGPDLKPKDLDQNMYAFLHDYNPNDPKMPKSALLFHNRWGILKKKSNVTTSPDMELGLTTQRRREGHRALKTGEDFDLLQTGRSMTLTETLMQAQRETLMNPRENRVRELVNTGWFPPNRTSKRRQNLAGGTEYGTSRSARITSPTGGVEGLASPRVVFISSRVPAAELLLDAVSFGVIPIVYEFEGTTAEALVMKLEKALDGRHAQSVGIFCHRGEPGEVKLTHGCTVSIDTLDYPEAREFFENLSTEILSSQMGGQVDIFSPLAASEPGMELIMELTKITGLQISSPTGVIGSYNHVNTEWCRPYTEGSPAYAYFCRSKLNVWANTADQALESVKQCRQILTPYFEKAHKDIAAQLAGEVVFDVIGQTEIHGVKNITTTLSEGLSELGKQTDVNPLEFLGQYLLDRAGVSNLSFTSTRQGKLMPNRSNGQTVQTLIRQFLQELSDLGLHFAEDVKNRLYEKLTPRVVEMDDEEEEEEDEEGEIIERKSRYEQTRDWDDDNGREEEDGEAKKDEGTEKAAKRKMKQETKKIVLETQELSKKFGTLRTTGKFEKLTVQKYTDHPEKRSPIAMEVASSEVEYNRLLHAVKNVYFKPLNAALKSNRAIISNQNLQIIFTDILAIMELSNDLKENLQSRVAEWDAQHSCLGDIFVKFCTQLKVYTNFVNNNEVILRCIERAKEQTPSFRAFLKRNDRTPETKMLTLQEMLLLPSRRINEYVTLLGWFELHTPKNHQDRVDLDDALQTLTELDRCIGECKLRMERDRQLVDIQRRVQNCPALLEANRYLIRQQDVAQLNPPKKDSEIPELQVFQHAAMYGLFLFNDALVLTRRMSKHFPFSRAVEYVYKYETSAALGRMRVLDIADSKDCRNAFKIQTPQQIWYFSTDTPEEKFNWVSLVEQSIRACLKM